MKILLADDHTVVRHGLKQILAEEFNRATFGEARNPQEGLDLGKRPTVLPHNRTGRLLSYA